MTRLQPVHPDGNPVRVGEDVLRDRHNDFPDLAVIEAGLPLRRHVSSVARREDARSLAPATAPIHGCHRRKVVGL